MARAIARDHLHRHRLLRELWLFVPSIYSTLLPNQQWEVHRLYAPDRFLKDEELLAHVRRSIATDPSLPNRVGKHWKRINQLYEWACMNTDGPEDWSGIHRALVRARVMGQVSLGTVPQRSRRKTGYVIRVAPIARPEPDYDKLARAFSELSQLMRESRGRDHGSESSS